MADGTKKNIEEVTVGDRVMAMDADGVQRPHEVRQLESPLREGYYEVALANKTRLRVTNEHPLYVKHEGKEGWGAIEPEATLKYERLTVAKIAVGDELKTEDGGWTEILSLTYRPGAVRTYNLKEVASANTFYADGVLAHNKGKGCRSDCCGWGGCNYSPGAPVRLKSPADGAQVPFADVVLSWYNNNWKTESWSGCVDWNDSGKCGRRETRTWEVPVPYTFGSRTCGPCSSAPGTEGGGGTFVVQVGPSPDNLVSVAGVNGGSYTLPKSRLSHSGTTYWRIRAVGAWSDTSSATWSFRAPLPSCTAALAPSSISLSPGQTRTLTATVSGDGDEVVFLSLNSSVATVTSPATSPPYTTTVTGVSPGATAVGGIGRVAGFRACVSNPVPVTVANPKWWQSEGGNVGSLGTLGSDIPAGKKFIVDPAGMAMAGGSSTLTTANVSAAGWLATNAPTASRLLTNSSYASLRHRVQAVVNPTPFTNSTLTHTDLVSAPPASDGVAYLHSTASDLTIANSGGPINLGSQKAVVLADGNVTISNPLRFNPGGLFVLLSAGNISIDPGVGETSDPTARSTADIMGVYLAQGRINTGAEPTGRTLRWEGAAIGLSGVNLQRGASPPPTYPAEYFVANPNILLSLPSSLLRQYTLWSETNP